MRAAVDADLGCLELGIGRANGQALNFIGQLPAAFVSETLAGCVSGYWPHDLPQSFRI